MIFITHLLAEEPEKLAGPLLADTYVTLLKGRNAWYGQMLAKGEINRDMGDSISGKGMIQVLLSDNITSGVFMNAYVNVGLCLNRVFLQWERFINCLVSLA